MKLLAWDTSAKSGAIAALESSESRIKLISEWSLNVEATHSERLLWAIHNVLESARWRLSDVDVFAVGVGPGSFTGLRIGITTARTLAHTLGKPLIGVSSLAALARPIATHAQENGNPLVAVVTDACKGELFALWGAASSVARCVTSVPQTARKDAKSLWQKGVKEQVITPEKLVKELRTKLKGFKRLIVAGDGRRMYDDTWNLLPTSRKIENDLPFSDHIQGRYLGLLAWEAYQAGLAQGLTPGLTPELTMDPLNIYPRYLRVSDAERKLKAGLLPLAPQSEVV